MIKKLLYILVFIAGPVLIAQTCPSPLLVNPVDGDMNVAVDTEIRWNGVPNVPAYILSIGTTPFGSEILEQNVGNATRYKPPLGLPDDTLLYITITLSFPQSQGAQDVVCTSESFRTAAITAPPGCTFLSSPLAGSTGVNVGTNISWNYAPTAASYDLLIGTTPGGGEIFDDNVGNSLNFNPPTDLPENTEIFVTVTPRNGFGAAIGCPAQSFTTGSAATLPGCTALISPADGATDVDLNPQLEWGAVPGAVGYRVSIGLSPFTAEILNNVSFNSNETPFIEFEPNRTFFVRIVPYNSAGEAQGCIQTTFSTQLGCGPFYDPDTGELVSFNPTVTLDPIQSFCSNEGSLSLSAPDVADGYRWYSVNEFGGESLLSEAGQVEIDQVGLYRYEAYNLIQEAGNLECSNSMLFEVVTSELATINSLRISGGGGIIRIEALVSGDGDYEYALDSSEGPYQDSPVFDGVPVGNHTVYVRDKNGCGIVSESLEQEVALDGFPRFFTPNGDGTNDYWQYDPPVTLEEIPIELIQVYDRYGKLLASFPPDSQGWDGTFGGRPLPSSDYWFRAEIRTGEALNGHFSLKR